MDNYCDTKAELFTRCDSAVLNQDDDWFHRIAAKATCPVLTTAVGKAAELQAEDVELHADGVSFTADYHGEKCGVRLPIPGR